MGEGKGIRFSVKVRVAVTVIGKVKAKVLRLMSGLMSRLKQR